MNSGVNSMNRICHHLEWVFFEVARFSFSWRIYSSSTGPLKLSKCRNSNPRTDARRGFEPRTPTKRGPQHSAKQRRYILFKAHQDVWKIYWQNISGWIQSTANISPIIFVYFSQEHRSKNCSNEALEGLWIFDLVGVPRCQVSQTGTS